MERDFLVWPTEMTRVVKENHDQSWSRIFWLDQIEMVGSINFDVPTKISSILGWMESALWVKFAMVANYIKPEAGNGLVLSMKGWRGTVECEEQKIECSFCVTVAMQGHVTFHMIYWTPLLIKSALSWGVFSGSRIWPKLVQDSGEYKISWWDTGFDCHSGNEICQNLGTGCGIGKEMIFWEKDLFI